MGLTLIEAAKYENRLEHLAVLDMRMFIRTVNHMGIGHDVPIGCQNEARTDAPLLLLRLRTLLTPWLLTRTGHRHPEKAAQQLLHSPLPSGPH